MNQNNDIPVPTHLAKNACEVKFDEKKSAIQFFVRCGCGGDRFTFWKNYFTDAEWKIMHEYNDVCKKKLKSFHSIIVEVDERGNVHRYKKGLFGKKEEIVLPREPFFMKVAVVKAVCASCGKEIVLYDSRLHGFKSLAEDGDTTMMAAYEPHLDQVVDEPMRALAEFGNDCSPEDTADALEIPQDSFDYANSFDCVMIFAVDESGKKEQIFDSDEFELETLEE